MLAGLQAPLQVKFWARIWPHNVALVPYMQAARCRQQGYRGDGLAGLGDVEWGDRHRGLLWHAT